MHKNVRILSWFNFFIDFVFYTPVAVLYFSRVSGSFALGMSIFSIVQVSSAFLELPTGMFSDMIGRKNTVVAGAVFSLLSVISYAYGGSYIMLCLGALLEGTGRAFYSGNNDALLHDSLAETNSENDYDTQYGNINGYNSVGAALVALTGSIMASISFSLAFWLSVLPRMILVLLSLRLVEPHIHSEKSTNIYSHLGEALSVFRTNKKVQLLTVISSLRNALYEGAYTFRTAFVATLWPVWALGIANTISNTGAALSFFYSGTILRKFGYKRVLVFELLINRVINTLALLFPTVVSPAFMGLTSLLYGATTTAVSTLQQKEFTTKQRATLGSLSSLFGSILFGVVAVALGAVGDRIGPTNALLIIQACILSILIFYFRFFALQ